MCNGQSYNVGLFQSPYSPGHENADSGRSLLAHTHDAGVAASLADVRNAGWTSCIVFQKCAHMIYPCTSVYMHICKYAYKHKY